MKTNVTQTSILAYAEELERRGEQQMDVYRAIRLLGSCNNKQIARNLRIASSTVSARVNELRKCGLVVNDGKGYCAITGKLTLFWKVGMKL